jgi:hypothetical protein
MKNKYLLLITLLILLFPFKILAYGGGASAPNEPIINNGSLIINNGETSTISTNVHLDIYNESANQMVISNSPDFKNASWEAYTTQKSWILEPGLGEKRVYIKFKSSFGNISPVISSIINLEKAKQERQADINNDGRVDDYDFSILVTNWGISGSIEADLNEDNEVNDYDLSILINQWTG